MAQVPTSSSAARANGHLQASARTSDQSLDHAAQDFGATHQPNDSVVQHHVYTGQHQPLPYDPSLLPNGRRSLASIGLQAFSLGFVLAFCSLSTVLLLKERKTIWRLPAFFACLSVFHFLEFWTTAQFNMPATRASSFLLRNGVAYTFAHGLATFEIIVSYYFPSYQSFLVNPYSISMGVAIVILGQLLRSAAMAEAGTNFNHTPAKIKQEGHVLVTTGVYSWLRHPSYCAFFWWALGTQILVGNKVSFLGYLLVLWNFFKRRVGAEERSLVAFFGKDYEVYRGRTATGIPFVK